MSWFIKGRHQKTIVMSSDLVGAFKYILFSFPIWGKISILTNLLRRGWNHQLVISGILQSFSLQIHDTISTHQNERAHILGKLPLGSVFLPACLSSHHSFRNVPGVTPPKINMSPKKGDISKRKFHLNWPPFFRYDMNDYVSFQGVYMLQPKFLTSQKKGCDPTIAFPGYIPQFFGGNLVAIDAFNVFARKVSAKDISSEVRFVGMRWLLYGIIHPTEDERRKEPYYKSFI